MKLEDFNYSDWIVQWAGSWSILSFSYFGHFYCRRPFSKEIDKYVDQTVIISNKGRSWAYQRQSIKEIFAKKLEKKIESDPGLIETICRNLKKATDDFLIFTRSHFGKDINIKQYNKFQDLLIDKYYPSHIEVKVVVDFLKPELLKKYLPILEKARIYAEPVFTKSEDFMRELAKICSKKTGIDANFILSTVNDEFSLFLANKKSLPDKSILNDRYKSTAILFDSSGMKIFTGNKVNEIEKIVNKKIQKGSIKGNIAYPGKVKGRVRIVFDPQQVNNFKKGEILVSGMTRPEFLLLMKKASGFVTDGGGILCHAAITARELKKPCIIGTVTATKLLKDGDFVEVDANKGIVRKLNR